MDVLHFQDCVVERSLAQRLALLSNLGEAADVIKVEALTGSYRYRLARMDQTQTPIGESAIEFVVRRRLPAEKDSGGLVGPARDVHVRRQAPSPQYLFKNLHLLRDVGLAESTKAIPHSVVIHLPPTRHGQRCRIRAGLSRCPVPHLGRQVPVLRIMASCATSGRDSR